MEIEVKEIGKFSRGYIVHYTITQQVGCCGFPTTRHSLYMAQTKKPTDKQAKQAIENELKNKR